MSTSPVLQLRGVGYVRGGTQILDEVDWTVEETQNWVVLGPNGSGKTTLARVATLWEHPSAGSVQVLGEELGHTDVRSTRKRIGFVSAAMADSVRPALAASEVVMCAANGALEPWWHQYDDVQRRRAHELLAETGLSAVADRPFGTLSSGERQRVLLARSHMAHPAFVVLDEPNAGLDLTGREELIDRLDRLANGSERTPTVLVTHHVEEIPPSFSHLMALRDGRVAAAGPIADVLDEALLASVFGVDVELTRHSTSTGIRWSAARR